MSRNGLAVWVGMALMAALNVYAYDFHKGDIIVYGNSTVTRYYYVFDSNMNYQTNQIAISYSAGAPTNYTPAGAIATDGMHPCFWVAYPCYTNSSTNLTIRRYDSTTSWVDFVSSIPASNAFGMARAKDKFYIAFVGTATLSTNYWTTNTWANGQTNCTLDINQGVSFNFRDNTWGTPFYVLNTSGKVDGGYTNNYTTDHSSSLAIGGLFQPAYLTVSNELWLAYDSAGFVPLLPDSATPGVQAVSWSGALPITIGNFRGSSAFSATQLVTVSASPVGATIWNPYNPAQYYRVMPGVGYSSGNGGASLNQIIRLASGQLLGGGGAPTYFLCDPVTGNYTSNYVAGFAFTAFAQITWPNRGTIFTIH